YRGRIWVDRFVVRVTGLLPSLEYPEKSELWHNAISSGQPQQTERLMYHVDDRINSGYKEVDVSSKQLP
ncbi:MAG: hypothetical protein U9Q68_04165, partial [Euryarchaeota archaeon]|nr:hypothetical protein [Euryarchaeota archaeon]